MTPVTGASSRRLRILFVGEIHSSHAQSWIRLLDPRRFEIRCFHASSAPLTPVFEPLTYLPFTDDQDGAANRVSFGVGHRLRIRLTRGRQAETRATLARQWLASIVRDFRPDFVHTFGLVEGATFFASAMDRFGPLDPGRWVLQLRGGSDLAFNHADPHVGPRLALLSARGAAVVTDNEVNFEYLEKLGIRIPDEKRLIAPGAGGVNVDELALRWKRPTRDRRIILWPKTYESPWSKALPVLEAIRSVLPKLGPCAVHALAATPEVSSWIRLMPGEIAQSFTLHPRIPHERAIEMMLEARVMLAPSLVDGTPNSMWEAMACGAVPIVSPLSTIVPVARADDNVLFARNLYPDEIASQLVRAMSDDSLVERISTSNLTHVRLFADRAAFASRLEAFLRSLL